MTTFPTRLSLLLALGAMLPLAACGDAETDDVSVAGTAAEAPVAVAPPAAPLNLNTATSEELATVPNVGERMIHEFEEYRPYSSIEQFRREMGKYIDASQVAAYEQYVFVPVDVNASDAATLQQIPGVGEAEAAALIEGRPYDSTDDFLARFAEVAPGADATAAARYLDAG